MFLGHPSEHRLHVISIKDAMILRVMKNRDILPSAIVRKNFLLIHARNKYKSLGNGCSKGQNKLGECYYHGNGTTEDYEKAFEWYSKAAS